MILLYKPTVQGPIERLDSFDAESRMQAVAFLRGVVFALLLRDSECAGCHQPILRGDVAWFKPIDGERMRGCSLSICRSCTVLELLPLSDACFGTSP